MHRLKKHQNRSDNIVTEVRSARGSYGKWIYLGLLCLLGLWLLDLFIGRYFYFQANGMIMRDIYTLGLSYPAQIRKQYVREGDLSAEGDLLAEVVSMQIIKQLTELTIEIANVNTRLRMDGARLKVINATIGMAEKRANDMVELRKKQESAVKRGLTSSRNLPRLLQDEFEAQLKFKAMTSERESLISGSEQLNKTRDELLAIHSQTQDLYQHGKVFAKKSGIIANVLSQEGSVIKPGDKILDILHGKTYVMAYLDPDTLYNIKQGDSVSIQSGFTIMEGKVDKIFPLSTELPKEFQRTFRPLERSTVMLISIEENAEIPPVYTTVEVYSSGVFLRWLKKIY